MSAKKENTIHLDSNETVELDRSEQVAPLAGGWVDREKTLQNADPQYTQETIAMDTLSRPLTTEQSQSAPVEDTALVGGRNPGLVEEKTLVGGSNPGLVEEEALVGGSNPGLVEDIDDTSSQQDKKRKEKKKKKKKEIQSEEVVCSSYNLTLTQPFYFQIEPKHNVLLSHIYQDNPGLETYNQNVWATCYLF